MQYEVRLPSWQPKLMIHVGMGRLTRTVGFLVTGNYVTVEAVCGERARISHPQKGWVSMMNWVAGEKFLFKCLKSSQVTSQRTESDAVREKNCMENISAIEARMQTITSSAEVTMDEKNALSELQTFKRFFLELMWPDMEWMCHTCTFLNTPLVSKCKMCQWTRPNELQPDMAVKLVKLLTNTKPKVEEKAEEKEDSNRIDQLGKQVDVLSAKYGQVAKQVDDLEEVNWQLSSRLVDVESTLSSCVLDTTNPKEWDVFVVCSWLERLGLGEYQEDFAEAMIDGESLLSCGSQKLEELDIRRKHFPIILKGLEELRKKWFSASNEDSEHKEQTVEQIVFTKGTNMPNFSQVNETTDDEFPATMKQKKPIPANLELKPRGEVPDEKDEVCTSNVGKTTFIPKRDLYDGWQFVGDV